MSFKARENGGTGRAHHILQSCVRAGADGGETAHDPFSAGGDITALLYRHRKLHHVILAQFGSHVCGIWTGLISLFCTAQVIRRLRERGEPIRLFGESDYDAFQRLRKIEILAPEVNKVR